RKAIDSRMMLTPKNARHDHASARRLATSGPHAPPMPPSAPQMPTASGCDSPSNMASIAASDVVKQQADATPCSARPAIMSANVSLTARSADAIANPTTPARRIGRADAIGDAADEEQWRGEREAGRGDDRAGD